MRKSGTKRPLPTSASLRANRSIQDAVFPAEMRYKAHLKELEKRAKD